MPEILKVTTPISVADRVGNLQKQLPDGIFNISNPVEEIKGAENIKIQKGDPKQGENVPREVIISLGKEILKPLAEPTTAQIDVMRSLVLLAKLFEVPSGKITEDFLSKLFIRPEELQAALLAREKGETPFKGEAFDILRVLSKVEGQPKVREAVAAILRHFDGMVNQENSLKAIVSQGRALTDYLFKADKLMVEHHVQKLETLIKAEGDRAAAASAKEARGTVKEAKGTATEAKETATEAKGNESKEISRFLKGELVPMLGALVSRYQQNDRIRNHVMAIIHYIVRFDKGEQKPLDGAIIKLATELKPVTDLTEQDFIELRKLLLDGAKELKSGTRQERSEAIFFNKFGIVQEKNDMPTLLSKALGQDSPPKLQSLGASLLNSMVESESPVMPLMHFMVPVKYGAENTYLEFFIDKNPGERKGSAREAKSIFFTIQSDKFGTFEVDLLAKDSMIDLDIKCPKHLTEALKETKAELRENIEENGYRLAGYSVSGFIEEVSIHKRFPKLGKGRTGIDVKI